MGGITVANGKVVTILSHAFESAKPPRVTGGICDYRVRFAVRNCAWGGFSSGAESARPRENRAPGRPEKSARLFSTVKSGVTGPFGPRQRRSHNV